MKTTNAFAIIVALMSATCSQAAQSGEGEASISRRGADAPELRLFNITSDGIREYSSTLKLDKDWDEGCRFLDRYQGVRIDRQPAEETQYGCAFVYNDEGCTRKFARIDLKLTGSGHSNVFFNDDRGEIGGYYQFWTHPCP